LPKEQSSVVNTVYRWRKKFIGSVNYTGEQFIAGLIDTCEQFIAGVFSLVSLIPVRNNQKAQNLLLVSTTGD
jgi:hypothetical protein